MKEKLDEVRKELIPKIFQEIQGFKKLKNTSFQNFL